MVESVIVTLIDKSNYIIGDFELPVKISVKQLSEKLAAFLCAMDSDKYIGIRHIQIVYEDKVLKDAETLYQNEIWDGSVLKIIF